jgi:putative SOS response-associated peptidase YedK
MPVVLGPEHFAAWLDCKTTELTAAQDMLQPAPEDLLEAIEMHRRSTIRAATSPAYSTSADAAAVVSGCHP